MYAECSVLLQFLSRRGEMNRGIEHQPWATWTLSPQNSTGRVHDREAQTRGPKAQAWVCWKQKFEPPDVKVYF